MALINANIFCVIQSSEHAKELSDKNILGQFRNNKKIHDKNEINENL